jgi:hypothetical protein
VNEMNIEVITRTEEEMCNCDYRQAFHIKINDKVVFQVWDGEPEDANLSRDFSDVYSIPELMREAYSAGKQGEDFKMVNVESADI